MVRILLVEVVQPWVGSVHSDHPPPQTGLAHEPFHASSAYPLTSASQRLVDARTAVSPVAGFEDRTDLSAQNPIPLGSRAEPTPAPGIEAGTRHAVQSAHPSYRVRRPL